jgi:hypothetical protein
MREKEKPERWEREIGEEEEERCGRGKKIRGTCGGGGGRERERERKNVILNTKVKVKNIILMI